MEFPITTNYHWPKFDDDATDGKEKDGYETVQGPFQFGLAVKLDNAKSQVQCLTFSCAN